MDPLTNTLAYKFVAMLIMLGEVNHTTEQLELPLKTPVTLQTVRSTSTINPPALVGFGGSVVTEGYLFGFVKGRLRYVEETTTETPYVGPMIPRATGESVRAIVSTNDAYMRAKTWLRRLDIDVNALESVHPPLVVLRQPAPLREGNRNLGTGNLSNPEPFVQVTWGEIRVHPRRRYTVPAVTVSISANSGRLIRLRIEGEAPYWRRALLNVRDWKALLRVSDDEFLRMSPGQRRSLFKAHTGVVFPDDLMPSQSSNRPHGQRTSDQEKKTD